MTTLYNLHTDGDQYRITKFVDGNPEASYLLSHKNANAPQGTDQRVGIGRCCPKCLRLVYATLIGS